MVWWTISPVTIGSSVRGHTNSSYWSLYVLPCELDANFPNWHFQFPSVHVFDLAAITLVITLSTCLMFTLVVALTRFLRFERCHYWCGPAEQKKLIDSVYNSGRKRIQRGIRNEFTAFSYGLMDMDPIDIQKTLLGQLTNMRHLAFALSSSAIAALVYVSDYCFYLLVVQTLYLVVMSAP